MKIKILLFLALFMSGCASLHSQVFEKIHDGDSKEYVLETLGNPSEFQKQIGSSDVMVMIYKKKADVCAISLKENKTVVNTECQTDANYVSPGAAFAKGFSKGYNSSPSMSCTSTRLGYTTQTNCQ